MLLSVPSKILCLIILDRKQETVDKKLRKEQAGFRKDKSCTYHIATLRIVVEQCTELQSSLYINFVDFEKTFDSIDRTVLWNLLRHYGLSAKCVTLIKNMHEGFTSHVIFNGQVSEGFQIGTGVRQGFLLSPLLFLIAIDWTMKISTEHYRTGIQWNLFPQLEDLDFADDLALLSETYKHMQQKTERLKKAANWVLRSMWERQRW